MSTINEKDIFYSQQNPQGFAAKLNAIEDLVDGKVNVEVVAGAAAHADGAFQVETATVAGTVTTAGNAAVVVTAAGMTGTPKTIDVAVAEADDASAIAGKIRTALAADAAVAAKFTVSGATDKVILTAKVKAANDTTLNISIADGTGEGACVGVTTAASSANTTAGVVSVAGTVSLAKTPVTGIIAILATVAASGAAATKLHLAPTTDYTVAGKVITCVTDQSANNLLVVYA